MDDSHPFSRAMPRDESIYSDPETFNPGRFVEGGRINLEVQNSKKLMSGHGRRYVLKRFAADASPPPRSSQRLSWKKFAIHTLFTTIACTIATFNTKMNVGMRSLPSRSSILGLSCKWFHIVGLISRVTRCD